jgi:hypothetical protein
MISPYPSICQSLYSFTLLARSGECSTRPFSIMESV